MQSEAQQERDIQHGRVFHRTRSKGQYTSRLHGSRDTRNTSTQRDSSRSGTVRKSKIYQEKQSIRGRGEHYRNNGNLIAPPPIGHRLPLPPLHLRRAVGAKPLVGQRGLEVNARKMEPLVRALVVVAADHLWGGMGGHHELKEAKKKEGIERG